MNPILHKMILDRATALYFDTGKFNYYWGRGKLGRDPIFSALIDRRIFPDNARVLDLGCGRGLLAAWFLAAEQLAQEKLWMKDTPQPPSKLSFRGVELMGKEAECGNYALAPFGANVLLEQGDVRHVEMGQVDVVAILDVLHYVNYTEQEHVLDRVRAALPAGGLFLTRVGDAAAGIPFHISQFADRTISFIQGHRLPRMWCRPLKEWVKMLEARDFTVRTLPMSNGTPFANIMVEAHLP